MPNTGSESAQSQELKAHAYCLETPTTRSQKHRIALIYT